MWVGCLRGRGGNRPKIAKGFHFAVSCYMRRDDFLQRLWGQEGDGIPRARDEPFVLEMA